MFSRLSRSDIDRSALLDHRDHLRTERRKRRTIRSIADFPVLADHDVGGLRDGQTDFKDQVVIKALSFRERMIEPSDDVPGAAELSQGTCVIDIAAAVLRIHGKIDAVMLFHEIRVGP